MDKSENETQEQVEQEKIVAQIKYFISQLPMIGTGPFPSNQENKIYNVQYAPSKHNSNWQRNKKAPRWNKNSEK